MTEIHDISLEWGENRDLTWEISELDSAKGNYTIQLDTNRTLLQGEWDFGHRTISVPVNTTDWRMEAHYVYLMVFV